MKGNSIKIIFLVLILLTSLYQSSSAYASCTRTSSGYEICEPVDTPTEICIFQCVFCLCGLPIEQNHRKIREYMSEQFRLHRIWMIDTYFLDNILIAMAQMASQMSAVSMQQMKIIGTFFDAKHQLETQRLFQQLMAQAHKDHQPSEGMCDIGSTIRGLVSSERKTNLTHQTLANRVMERQLRTGKNLAEQEDADMISRIDLFKKAFCSKKDNANGLHNMCAGITAPRKTINKDVDYTRAVETELTLDIDYAKEAVTADEKSTFALMANLFAHQVLTGNLGRSKIADEHGNPRMAAYKYMDLRSVAAKRSVAQNSISSIIAERSNGDEATEYAPFLKSVIVELGIDEKDVDFILGKNPSYFAQMEVLTKKLYQNPVFYTELYDKPTNVLRKRASIRAINLIQDRDLYKSLLRTEAVLSVLLESMLNAEHDRVYSHINRINPNEEGGNE